MAVLAMVVGAIAALGLEVRGRPSDVSYTGLQAHLEGLTPGYQMEGVEIASKLLLREYYENSSGNPG